jgi:hypothetical protein
MAKSSLFFEAGTYPVASPLAFDFRAVEKIEHARQMIDSEEQSVSGMAKLLGVHRVTLHKGLKRKA